MFTPKQALQSPENQIVTSYFLLFHEYISQPYSHIMLQVPRQSFPEKHIILSETLETDCRTLLLQP
jgi:hypothetical protein